MTEEDVYEQMRGYLAEANYVKIQKLYDRVICGERSRRAVEELLVDQGEGEVPPSLVNGWINNHYDELMQLCIERRGFS